MKRMRTIIAWLVLGWIACVGPTVPKAPAAPLRYVAEQVVRDGIPVIRLFDAQRDIEVLILPASGNSAYAMNVRGKNILGSADVKPADFQKGMARGGIPFMAPWANRLDSTGFWANGVRYSLDAALGSFRKDQNGLPLHGLLSNSPYWKMAELRADQRSASVTSRLDFWKHPDLMAQWPFAHAYEMTYLLSEGALQVRIAVSNLGAQAMPLAIGFHPYFRIPDVPRDQWILRNPARKAVLADSLRLPTGNFKAIDLPNPMPLKDRVLDDGFTDLEREADGRAVFSIEAGGKQIRLFWGPKFPVAIIWEPVAPSGAALDFICIEPMTGITNALNLYQAGKYPELQSIPAGGIWAESFSIQPVGF